MKKPEHTIAEFVGASDVRRSLVVPGDIRGEVSFQNDLNALIAIVDTPPPVMPWRALGELPEPPDDSGGDSFLHALVRRWAA